MTRPRFKLCPRCGGKGKHAPQGYSWTREMRDADPEGFADYMAGGMDEPCGLCGGERVVPVGTRDERASRPQRFFVAANGDHTEMPGADY